MPSVEELLAKIGDQFVTDVVSKVMGHPDYLSTVEAYAAHLVDVLTGRVSASSQDTHVSA